MEINGYTLANEEKVRRAAEGSPTSQGTPSGGVGYEDEAALLAQYDKLGGLILNSDNRKVKTGSFWDFKENSPRKKPEVVLLIQVGFDTVEVPEGEPLPIEAQAAEILAESKKKGASKKKAVVKGKGRASAPKDEGEAEE